MIYSEVALNSDEYQFVFTGKRFYPNIKNNNIKIEGVC